MTRLLLAVLVLSTAAVRPAAAQMLSDLYRITDGVTRTQSELKQLSVPKGGQLVLADFEGPGKVTYFYYTDSQMQKYPGLVLKIFWDDAKEPSIEAPLWDFFGAIGGKMVDYHSAPMQVNQRCFMSYLPMPFSSRARFVLANDGDRDYRESAAYGVDREMDSAYAQEKGRLHCKWRRSNPVRNGLHTMLDAQGRGQYVGCFLQAVSKNPAIWFGEGDMIFHLDGKSAVHSPGTEDEYGSCWADPRWSTYSSAVCGHVLNENGVNRMYRWYLANPVRFQESLKVEIQNQHENGKPAINDPDDYTSVTYWYQEGTHEVGPLPPFEERTRGSFAEKP